MLHKNIEIEQKHNTMTVLKDKKARLEVLNNNLQTTFFLNYPKKKSLNAEIQALKKEIVMLIEQAIQEGFIKHDDPRLRMQSQDKIAMANQEVMKAMLFPYLTPSDFGRLSTSSVTLYAQTAETRLFQKLLSSIVHGDESMAAQILDSHPKLLSAKPKDYGISTIKVKSHCTSSFQNIPKDKSLSEIANEWISWSDNPNMRFLLLCYQAKDLENELRELGHQLAFVDKIKSKRSPSA